MAKADLAVFSVCSKTDLDAAIVAADSDETPPLNLLRFLGKQSQSIGPYSLVQLAYKGDLVKQGIPGQATLLAAHRDGQLSASRLVLGARLAKIVSPQMAACPIYQDAVETALLMHYLWRPNQQLTGDLNSRFE